MSDHDQNRMVPEDDGAGEASGPRSKDAEEPVAVATVSEADESDKIAAATSEEAQRTDPSEISARSDHPTREMVLVAPQKTASKPPAASVESDRITSPPNTECARAQEGMRAPSTPPDETPGAERKGGSDVFVAPTMRPDPFRDWSDLDDQPLPPPAPVPSPSAAPRARIPTGPKATGERRGGLGMFRSTAVAGTPSPSLLQNTDNAATEPPAAADTERPKAATEAPQTPKAHAAQPDVEDADAKEAPATASPVPSPAPPPVAAVSAAPRAAATAAAPPKERVVLQGPRGTALLGVPKPNAPIDAKGPRGTAVMGLARPALKKSSSGDLGSNFENEATTSASFTHLATTEKTRMAQVVVGSMIGVLLAMGLGALLLFFVFSNRQPAAATGQPVASAPPEPAPEVSSAPAASASAPAATGPDAVAIAALETLRRSVETCMKELKALPGTSPAVPRSLAFLAKGPYRSSVKDWSSPTYSCTNFKMEDPMPFAIQWQYISSEKAGRGVAWLDDNGDGAADRAYAFTAKVVGAQAVEFGKVGPIDPTTRMEKVFGY